ncbi:MAG: hypothetical protein JWM85_2938, partial [Acidimicrobiaceae bacterium]|nr:hypothetical protein [Acidimicrobiaceae bacterium]
AAAVLGYLDPDNFLGGSMDLDLDAARRGIAEQIAAPLDLPLWRAAAGILSVMVAGTTGALRQVTVERGRDLREYSLLAFGGAGPLFVPLIGREVGARQVVVPHNPAVFSAWGMLGTDVVEDVGRTVLAPLVPEAGSALDEVFAELCDRADERVRAQCSSDAELRTERLVELRYAGQEHALAVELEDGAVDPTRLAERFGELHRRLYGHQLPNAVQVLAARATVRAVLAFPAIPEAEVGDDPERARRAGRNAFDFAAGAMVPFACYDRTLLRAGERLVGPAVIEEATTVTVLQSDQCLEVDRLGHLVIGAHRG